LAFAELRTAVFQATEPTPSNGKVHKAATPTQNAVDRALFSIFGATAVEQIAAGDFEKMVSFSADGIGAVGSKPLWEGLKRSRPTATWRAPRGLWAPHQANEWHILSCGGTIDPFSESVGNPAAHPSRPPAHFVFQDWQSAQFWMTVLPTPALMGDPSTRPSKQI
jgi:hypothetical protein